MKDSYVCLTSMKMFEASTPSVGHSDKLWEHQFFTGIHLHQSQQGNSINGLLESLINS